MAIEPEHVFDAPFVHELEADTVNQAETSTVLLQYTASAPAVQGFRHPLHREHWKHVLIEGTHRLQSNAALKQRNRFDENIRRRPQWPTTKRDGRRR